MNKKITIVLLILIILTNTFMPVIKAAEEITKANLIYGHKIDTHIMFYNAGAWYPIKCGYICYEFDKETYPAYCISHGLHGVDEEGPYTVSINDLLKDKLIYNTIINGYPYKTPEQLGVETADDAYVATKHAVNSVVLNRDVRSFYKAADSKGERIINAIYNISEKGKAGNEENNQVQVEIKKVGELTENEEYYSQEYSIKSNSNISKYEVKETIDFPEGTLVSDINGNLKSSFNNYENFKILLPKNKMNKDIFGKINIIASCNTKSIFYGEAPRNGIQNYAITYKPDLNHTASINLNLNTNTCSIKVIKKDEETLKPISNVMYSLYKEDKTLIDSQVTDSNGIIAFNNLYQGKYILKEIKANDDYIKDENEYSINTIYNKQIVKELTNKHKKGNLKITKVDKDDNSITLGAIEFDLIEDKNKNVIAHLITDVNGNAYIEDINIGNYILRETKTKREYNLCVDTNLSVKWNETSDLIIENEKKKGQIKIIKVDKDYNDIKLEGIEFQIMNKNNRIIEKIQTNKDGEALSSRLPIGEYKIKEVNLGKNTNYLINDMENIIQVENNITKELEIENEHKKGKLKISKIDKDEKDKGIGNVKFEITDKDGFKYYGATDEKGILEINDIREGTIFIKETETNKEYKLLKNEIKSKIDFNKLNEITIENEKKKGRVEITKIDEENIEIKIPKVEFQIIDSNNNVVDKIITDNKGKALTKELPIGEYYLKETKTNPKYILNDEIIKLNIEEDKVLKLDIKNKKIKGKISILKLSSKDSDLLRILKGDKIEGVVFDIYNENSELVDTVVTDNNGEAISKPLEVGRYRVKEIKTKNGYLLNKNEFFAKIENEGDIKLLKIENDPIIPNIKIEKYGPESAQKNEEIKYEFEIKNSSNTQLNNFTWKEYIPFNQLKVTKMITGTYTEELNYKLYYKTNKKEYQLLREINTYKSEYINFDDIKLDKDEKIIEIKIDFETVLENFSNNLKPTIFCIVNENVKKDEIITNYTEVNGNIDGFNVYDKAKSETIIIENKIIKKLPKTGC